MASSTGAGEESRKCTLSQICADGEPRQWPGDFYSVEIHEGFVEIDRRKKLPHQTVTMIFKDVFGVEYIPGTYYDHRARWNNAPHSACEAVCKAGRTNGGLYSEFMKSNPAKHAKEKAVRKRFVRAVASEDCMGSA
jgi:hypothetical protein